MLPEPSRTDVVPDFAAALLAGFRRWSRRLGNVVPLFYRRVSSSKLCWAAMAGAAAVPIVATLKFSTILHGLFRLADVGGNVNAAGAAGVGAAGAGVAGGATGKPPGQKPGPLPPSSDGGGPLQPSPGDAPIDPKAFPSSGAGSKA